jgi:hypothetical protein
MPAMVKIKEKRYGEAINLLLMRGGSFQTRHERLLIVTGEQLKVLEEAGLIETEGTNQESGKDNGHKKDAS